MDYEGSVVDDYESALNDGEPTSWENTFNITDQFLTSDEITVSGTVLYHQLFDLTSDTIDNTELNNFLDDIEGAYFGIQLPDNISIAHIRTVGTPYEYDVSVQGFPIDPNGYDQGTYCKFDSGASQTRNFDTRSDTSILNGSVDYSLEFAANGSKYIVFYQELSTVQNYADGDLIMVDYGSYHAFAEGFDYNIVEDPTDPFVSTLVWTYAVDSASMYSLHPDFTTSTSFTIDYSALEWDLASDRTDYINDGSDEFTFQPLIKTNISVMYYGDVNDSFSILNIVPDDQFNDSYDLFKWVYVQIWTGEDPSTIEIYRIPEYAALYNYVYQDENCSFYYWINFTKCEERVAEMKPGYTLVPDSYVFIEVQFISDQLKYALSHTPFNYDYTGVEHTAYHITLSIPGENPIYSYDKTEFEKYVLKIENNYIYFTDKAYGENGYIANETQITVSYKFKLQPGLLDEEHFFMVILPWTNVFGSTIYDDIYTSAGGAGLDDDGTYRDRFRKLSGSSDISPFEYSLSINDTYGLYLSYRLNQREYYEQKFEFDYASANFEFEYSESKFEPYFKELDDIGFYVYYYDFEGKPKELESDHYIINTNDHTITLKNDGNPVVSPNSIREFYLTCFVEPHDSRFKTHTFTFDPNNVEDSIDVKHWSVEGGDHLDVVPNLNVYYYLEEGGSSETYSLCRAFQINAYLDSSDTLVFNLADELAWYDYSLRTEIQAGDKYSTLYINTIIENYEATEELVVGLYTSSSFIENQTITIEELIQSDFALEIDIFGATDLDHIKITPKFRTGGIYSANNTIGVPRFDALYWDDVKAVTDNESNRYINFPLDYPLFTDSSPLELAYMFNEGLEYLALPTGVEFTWTTEEILGEEVYILKIPNSYIDPDTQKVCSFEDGQTILLRYNAPVEEKIEMGIEELYFQKTPQGFSNFPVLAECLLINTSSSEDYTQFTYPYSYNITIPLTPFKTEFLGNYLDILIEVNLSALESFAQDGYIDFSHIVLSVPNPTYELTLHDIAIIQESVEPTELVEEYYSRVWQYTEVEEFTSSSDPTKDGYILTLTNDPVFYNDQDNDKWLEFLKIWDENYNYYSACDPTASGIDEDDYQLHLDSATGNFTWNEGFSKFQDYWGMQIELPAIIGSNTTLYFEYCTEQSWTNNTLLEFTDIDTFSLDVIYNGKYLLTPRYEEWYGEIYDNNEIGYDYEVIQYYTESFAVYSSVSQYNYTFEIEFDFEQDFVNLSIYEIIGYQANLTETEIIDDNINYNIIFNTQNKTITIEDLISGDGLLNQFDSISITLNFTSGPVSSHTELIFTESFNQTYLGDIEATFYDYLVSSFSYSELTSSFLFVEEYNTIISSSSSFVSIDYSRNTYLSTDNILTDYDAYGIFINYEIFEDPYNVIYEADINQDGEPDYKQLIDIDKDGVVDITKYGIQDPEDSSQIVWYRVIQNYEMVEEQSSDSSREDYQTEWFDIELNDLKFPESKGLEVFTDYWGKRFRTEYISTQEFFRNKYYSVKIDEDFDGFADSQIIYEKSSYVVNTIARVVDTTVIGHTAYQYMDEVGYNPDRLFSIDNFVSEFCSQDISSLSGFEKSFLDTYMAYLYTIVSFEPSEELMLMFLRESYQKYTETTDLYYSSSAFSESLTVLDLHLGEVVEARTYSDEFIDDASLYDFEQAVETLSLTNYDSGQEVEFEIEDLFTITNISQVDWETPTWGVDNVPDKFDSLIIEREDDYNVENRYDETVKIRIPNRYSLFDDYLTDNPSSSLEATSTIFRVSGVFMTPSDGVYYTSDKDSFMATRDHRDAKTSGHYLFYDSDLNGFEETVFILAPDTDNDGIYDVIAIGYNYDGSRDFVPYKTIEMTSDLFGTSYASYDIGYFTESEEGKSNKEEYFLTPLDLEFFIALEIMYPKDLFDGYVAKDQIFEISKLVMEYDYSSDNEGPLYPELYESVWKKEFADAWNSYESQAVKDILNQVVITTIAGTASALTSQIPYVGTVLSPFVFAGVYLYLSWQMHLEQKKQMERLSARSYFSEGGSTNPKYLSNKVSGDVLRGGLVAATNDHPGAYYTTVFGQGKDCMYEGEVVVSHPANWRSNEWESYDYDWTDWFLDWVDRLFWKDFLTLDDEGPGRCFTNYNLDYFFLTSELLALPEILEPDLGEDEQHYYSVSLFIGSDYGNLYKKYRTNTIGYLENVVKTTSGGQFDTIRPNCINGIPQYIFVDSLNEDVSNTLPLEPDYQPIIVSNERYAELDEAGLVRDALIKVRVDCAYSLVHDDSLNAYQLHPAEAELYKAKVPLSYKEFNYPISNLIITYGMEDEAPLIVREINPSDYVVVDGNLYFYHTLEDIIFLSFVDYVKLTPYADYDIYIVFPTIIPYSETINSNNRVSDNLDLQQDFIDTTTNERGRTVLAQTCSYAISDYFNQYWMAAEDGQNKASLDYTVLVTGWSTLISSIILVPISAGIASTLSSKLTFAQGLAVGSIAVPAGVATEIFEELYVDPVIENYVNLLVQKSGGSSEAAQFWSMFACSIREGLAGGVSGVVDTVTQIKSRSRAEYTLNTEASLEAQKNEITSEMSTLQNMGAAQSLFGGSAAIGTIATVAFATLGAFFGGIGPAIGSLAFDLSTDVIVDKLRAKFQLKGLHISLQAIEREIEARGKYFEGIKAMHLIESTNMLLNPTLVVQNTPTTQNPLTHPATITSFDYSVLVDLHSARTKNLDLALEYQRVMSEKKDNIEGNLKDFEVMEESSNLLASTPIERVSVALEDPRYVVIAEQGIKKFDRATYIDKTHTIHKNTLFVQALTRIRGDSLHVYKGIIINKEGVKIAGLGDFLNNKYGHTRYTDEVTSQTIEFDILEFLGYDLTTRPATDPIYVIPISKRYNPSLKIDGTSIDTVRTSILPLVYGELFESQKIADFVSDYKLLFDQYPRLFENILIGASTQDIESFIDKFNDKVDVLLWEIFHITDYNMFRGEFLSQITLSVMKNRFMDKWLIDNPTTSKEIEWNNEVNDYWGDRYEKVLKSTGGEVKYDIFKNCFGLSLMHTLFTVAETNKIKDFGNILTELDVALDKGSLNNIMARTFLIDTFIRSSFGVFQITNNEYGVLRGSYSTFSEWKGYLAEADEVLNYLPLVLRDKFLSGAVFSLSKIISKFYFGSGRDKISSDPHILLSSNFRFPDLDIWKFELNDNEDFDIEYILQASKYSMNNDYVSESIIDILSSLYVAIRENIQSDNPKLKLSAEASLLNLLSQNSKYSTFKLYFKFLLDNFADKIYNSELNFYDFKTGVQWKVDKLLVAEEGFIIKELNEYIWKKFDYSLSTNQYFTELASLSSDASFILKIYNTIKNKNFGTITIERIGAFLKDLVKRSTSIVSTITTLSYNDKIVIIPSINKISNVKYYRITDKYASGQYGILKKVFDLDSSNNQYQNGFDIESSTEFKKAYKIIHTFDSNGNPIHGLAQISQNKLVSLPDGWFDGLIIQNQKGQDQLINNLVFTDHFGHLLSSPYFNPNTDTFMIRDISLINKEIWDNPLGTYGINILIDFSKTDPKGQMNSLITVDLINSEFNTYINYHLPPNIGNYFENLDTSPLIKLKSKARSLKSKGDLSFHPIDKTSKISITTEEFYELYYNIVGFPSQDAPGILYPNTYILGLLEEMNAVFDPSSGYIDPSSKRSIEDNEGVLNRLFKNKAEIRDFLLINAFGDPLHDTEFSIKDWLSFIFDKITDPTLELGNDRTSQLLKEALNSLDQYKTESGSYENPFDTSKIWFSETGVVSELKHGKFVFKVINRLFGHVSLMYLFLHSIDVYQSISGFKLDFCTISPSSKKIEAFVKQYNIQASSQEYRYGALQRGTILNHIFSLLFGNSFMHLPIKSDALTIDNRIYFEYSPMPFLSDLLYASSPQELNSLVQNYFQIGYTEYISKKNIGTVYTESCGNMLDVFKVKLWDTIAARHLGIAETTALYEQALIQAKFDIFRSSIESRGGKFSIRYQIENLLIGYHYSHSRFADSENCYQRGIVFHNLKVQKVDRFGKVILDNNGNPIMEPLIVFLNKDDFKGNNIQIFRKASKKYDLSNTLEQNFLTSTLDKTYTIIQMILKNNGKATFFTAINRGPQYGHQYINIVPGQTFQHLRSYYDINLDLDVNGRIKSTEANQKELEKIEFLVALSGTYIEYSKNIKSSIMLIMKEEGAGMGDNSICGINHDNIFEIRAIHSKYGAPDGDGYILQLILGSLSTTGNYYIGPNNNIDPNKIWSRFSNFQPVSQTTFLKYYDPAIWD